MRIRSLIAAALVVALEHSPPAMALDSGSKALGNTVGATDLYRLTCATDSVNGDTDHLSFKIIDATPLPPGSKQLLNFHVTKDSAATDATAVQPGDTRELSLPGGNGVYTVTVDTQGTNPDITKPQSYKLGFQCLNAAGEKTRTSAKGKSGRLKNDRSRSYRVKCSRRKAVGDTDRLLITIIDKTPNYSPLLLSAQITKGQEAANVADTNGDETYSPEIQINGGNGEYLVTVDNTGTDVLKDNSKIYSFQAGCLSKTGADTGGPVIEPLQNQ